MGFPGGGYYGGEGFRITNFVFGSRLRSIQCGLPTILIPIFLGCMRVLGAVN